MGKVRFDRKAVRHRSSTVRPNGTTKRRPKSRGMKTRILGLMKALKEFLMADTYMYGPILDPQVEAAMYQCREGAGGLMPPREGGSMEEDASRLAQGDIDAGGACRVDLNDAGLGAAAAEDSDDVGKSQDSDAHGSTVPLGVEQTSPGVAAPTSADRPTLTPKGEELVEPDKPRKELVRVRLRKITRTAIKHSTAALAANDGGGEARDRGGDAAEEEPTPVDEDEDADGDDESLHESLEEPEDSECSMGFSPKGSGRQECLESDEAAKVVQQLVDKFGGRYSEELGIDVDKGDTEVERWFLASVLFNRRSSFDPSTETLRKLQEGGLQKLGDAADWKEDELAGLWESLGNPDLYNQRSAARLHKLVRQLHTNHAGNIASLKGISNYEELHEAISKLYGVGPSTADVFLRELRGTWPGASPDLGTRSLSALRHLRLVDPNLDAPYSLVCSCLKHIANQAGVDFRDIEAALIRFGQTHARNYRRCPGGLECETWTSIPQRTRQKRHKFE